MKSSKTFYLVYVSSAVVPFTQAELEEMLEKARINNATLGITGLLLNDSGNFMQLLEGPEEAVRTLAAKIERDTRHRGMLTLLTGFNDERQFPEWKMAFKKLGLKSDNNHEAFSDFLNTPLNSSEFVSDPTAGQKLLLSFKKNLR